MTHYVAIVEEEPGKAVGVWFPDLPGCISAGDTVDEAIDHAAQALKLWAEAMVERGQSIPPPRTLTELKADPEIAPDLARYMVALVPLPDSLDRKSTRLNSSHVKISYAVFCLKKKKKK